jgi:hypothetical protein
MSQRRRSFFVGVYVVTEERSTKDFKKKNTF